MNRIFEPEARPSPDALLKSAVREQRARLKVFVGAAPGVGKTYAMLQAAHERRREGVDVVVGVVETHGRAETEALLQGLEAVPRAEVDYRGTVLHEMDLDAILARHPQLVLVDELAHTNAPGCRHPKRFSDVEELLDAGIDVYTTVNIQHIESLNDVVAQITGVTIRETVPDRLLERADEVKLVDVTPEDLLQRLREGKVYLPAAAERAIRNYFRPGNLTALRELALRHTAERVDDQMRTYMQAHAVQGVWPVAERVMVCISGGTLSERLIRAGRRMADRRRAEWLVAFVETSAFHRLPETERDRIASVLRLAEQLGAEVVTVPGDSVADEIIRLAERRNVTELVLGKSRRSPWRSWWTRSPVDAVIRRSGNIDVRVITGEPGTEEGQPAVRSSAAVERRPLGYLVGLGLVAGAGIMAKVLQQVLDLPDPALLFLTAVLFTAVAGGLGPSIVAALASLLVYDFCFVQPLYTFTVTKPQDVLSLAVFLIVATLTSNLMSRIRDQAEAARRREARTAALYAFSRELAAAAGLDDLLPAVVHHVADQFQAQALVLMPASGRLVVRAAHPSSAELGESDRAAATWVWEHNQAAGRGTDTLPGGQWFHVPLHTARGAVGVLALHPSGPPGRVMPLDQRQLLEALAGQAAIAIERTRVDVVLAEKAKTEAVMEAIEDGLIVLDQAGTVGHVNEVACAILGMDRVDVLGRRFEELGSRQPHYLRLRTAVRDFLARPEREGERIELALFLRGRDHYYVLRPTPFRAPDGTHAGVILALQDVTYLRDQEARREHLVATLSHELGTPLTSLRMALELLRRDGGFTAEQRNLLDTAHEDLVRLQDVGQRLVDLSRSRAMSIAIERDNVDLHEVIPRVLKPFQLQAREKGVVLETDVPEAGVTIAGDPIKLSWAVSNLVANALRYTPAGGRVRIAVVPEDGAVLLAVTDTGPGIPVGQRDRIFERFAQGADAGELGSAGLGLAIVRDIVQAHGGRVHLESEVGHGSRFTLELPRG